MSLADDLRALMSFTPDVCKICALLKTLPEEAAHVLVEAYLVGVSNQAIYETLQKNGHAIGYKQVAKHRNQCLDEA